MKLIGLSVIVYMNNFGSALQTYATQRVVRKIGYDTKVFDISEIKGKIEKRKILYYLTRLLHKDERNYVLSMAHAFFKKKKHDDEYAKNMATKRTKFTNFYNDNIVFFPKSKQWIDLSNQAKQCDVVLVGSDQLWGSANIAGGYFTLEFVPDNVKKVAYSTSFGVSVLPKQLHKHARKFLNRIEYVSVREDSGKELVKQLTDRDIPVVCDPTMLLTAEEWLDIQDDKPFTDGDYILTYFMGDNPEQRKFVERLKEKTGYKIVGLLHGSTYIETDEHYCDETPYNVGPGEFLNLIRFAKYVCTDSYHCTVFSILYETDFFAFPRDAEGSSFSANDRLHTLLGWTGLQDRWLSGRENVEDKMGLHFDRENLQKLIADKRKESLDYLKQALNQ